MAEWIDSILRETASFEPSLFQAVFLCLYGIRGRNEPDTMNWLDLATPEMQNIRSLATPST